jgi:hypothetical protein
MYIDTARFTRRASQAIQAVVDANQQVFAAELERARQQMAAEKAAAKEVCLLKQAEIRNRFNSWLAAASSWDLEHMLPLRRQEMDSELRWAAPPGFGEPYISVYPRVHSGFIRLFWASGYCHQQEILTDIRVHKFQLDPSWDLDDVIVVTDGGDWELKWDLAV